MLRGHISCQMMYDSENGNKKFRKEGEGDGDKSKAKREKLGRRVPKLFGMWSKTLLY